MVSASREYPLAACGESVDQFSPTCHEVPTNGNLIHFHFQSLPATSKTITIHIAYQLKSVCFQTSQLASHWNPYSSQYPVRIVVSVIKVMAKAKMALQEGPDQSRQMTVNTLQWRFTS